MKRSEHPFTKLENETLEALARSDFTSREFRVVFAILRLTNGYHLTENKISQKYLQQLTGITRENLYRTLKILRDKQIIHQDDDGMIAWHGPTLWDTNHISASAKSALSQLVPASDIGKDSQEESGECQLDTSSDSVKVSSPASAKLALAQLVPAPAINSDSLKKTIKENLKKTIKENSPKIPYGEFQNVFLTDEEYGKLKMRFGAECKEKIDTLSEGMATKPKEYKYESHYAAVLTWARRDEKKGRNNGQKYPGTGGPQPAQLSSGESLKRKQVQWNAEREAANRTNKP